MLRYRLFSTHGICGQPITDTAKLIFEFRAQTVQGDGQWRPEELVANFEL